MHLSKLPCWADKSDEEYQQAIRELHQSILEKHQEIISRVPKGAPRRLVRQDPEYRPDETKSSPKPICHAASREERRRYREQQEIFVAAYHAASKMLRSGNLAAFPLFPEECFLPRMPAEVAALARAA